MEPALERFFNELVMQGRLAEIGEIPAVRFCPPELKTESGDPRFEMQVPTLPFENLPSARKKGAALERFFNELVMQGHPSEIGEIPAVRFCPPELKAGALRCPSKF